MSYLVSTNGPQGQDRVYAGFCGSKCSHRWFGWTGGRSIGSRVRQRKLLVAWCGPDRWSMWASRLSAYLGQWCCKGGITLTSSHGWSTWTYEWCVWDKPRCLSSIVVSWMVISDLWRVRRVKDLTGLLCWFGCVWANVPSGVPNYLSVHQLIVRT